MIKTTTFLYVGRSARREEHYNVLEKTFNSAREFEQFFCHKDNAALTYRHFVDAYNCQTVERAYDWCEQALIGYFPGEYACGTLAVFLQNKPKDSHILLYQKSEVVSVTFLEIEKASLATLRVSPKPIYREFATRCCKLPPEKECSDEQNCDSTTTSY